MHTKSSADRVRFMIGITSRDQGEWILKGHRQVPLAVDSGLHKCSFVGKLPGVLQRAFIPSAVRELNVLSINLIDHVNAVSEGGDLRIPTGEVQRESPWLLGCPRWMHWVWNERELPGLPWLQFDVIPPARILAAQPVIRRE